MKLHRCKGVVFTVYTIGQFARICLVSPKALRYYEKLGLLVPIKVDPDNGYRYYDQEQVDSLKAILFLKDLGIPLKTIKQVIARGSQPEEIMSLLENHRSVLLQELDGLNQRLVKLSQWRIFMEANEMSDKSKYDIRLQDVRETLVYSSRQVLTEFFSELPQLFRTLLDELLAKGGICAGAPIILYYDDFNQTSFNPQKADMEVAWPVADPALANNTLPALRVATCTHVGPYDGLEKAYGAVFTWINDNGYQSKFPTREVYLNDPSATPPEQLVTEIQIPIQMKA
ncbi:MAG: MerR family transcriptional regulator [Syntrophomonas sp.]